MVTVLALLPWRCPTREMVTEPWRRGLVPLTAVPWALSKSGDAALGTPRTTTGGGCTDGWTYGIASRSAGAALLLARLRWYEAKCLSAALLLLWWWCWYC